MKHVELTNAKLTHYERRSNSANGNPSYNASFSNVSEDIAGKTASDAKCGYALENFRDGRACNVTYHVTRAGNTVINKIQEA